ncbi:unnamed protein product, partial [Laminaria digitata]
LNVLITFYQLCQSDVIYASLWAVVVIQICLLAHVELSTISCRETPWASSTTRLCRYFRAVPSKGTFVRWTNLTTPASQTAVVILQYQSCSCCPCVSSRPIRTHDVSV